MSDSVSDFQYSLPQRLIARYPASERTASRLLCLDGASGAIEHRRFSELPSLLLPGDLLVFNDTRVMPARLVASKRGTGGRVEILIERILSDGQVLAQLKASRPPRPGTLLDIHSGENPPRALEVLGREQGFFRLRLADGEITELLEGFGHVPLPPYLDREDEALDRERYQTIYARVPGAVAAPTAGLHFDQSLLERLTARGVRQAWVTLHVGAGTFRPVRCERIEDHKMHAELVEVQSSVCELVHDTYRRGGRVVAVGTTSVRCLEAAAAGGRLEPMRGDTDIFIYPPYRFRVIDAMITNFHLPESTLLMLVSAFAGRERILAAYQEAIRREYRFFSYGDAMFISAASKPLLREGLD